jgi:hypothetical protein
VHFFDATGIFDEVASIIYADSCCHYNNEGNRILVARIVRELEAVLLRANRSAGLQIE